MSIYREWIISRTKKFRRHFHCKINSLALSLLFLPIITLATNGDASANVVVNKVNTKVALFFDNKDINFETDAFDVRGAISSENIEMGKNDVTEPSVDTKLNGGVITVKIKRALPLFLDDDGKKSVIYSGYEDVPSILNQNSITVYPEDKITDSIVTDFFSDQSVGRKIVIERAPVLYVNVDGATKELRSWEKTVGEAIRGNGILFGDKDKAEPGLETYLTNKVAVTITRVAESEVKEEEAIPFNTKTMEDPNLEYGRTSVKQDGINGLKVLTYNILSENGVMVSKTLISVNILSQPQEKVIVKGTKLTIGGSYSGVATYYSGPTKVACNLFRKGTVLRITNLNTGKFGLYVVDDTGGFSGSKIVDLRRDIYQELGGSLSAGLLPVKIEQVLN